MNVSKPLREDAPYTHLLANCKLYIPHSLMCNSRVNPWTNERNLCVHLCLIVGMCFLNDVEIIKRF